MSLWSSPPHPRPPASLPVRFSLVVYKLPLPLFCDNPSDRSTQGLFSQSFVRLHFKNWVGVRSQTECSGIGSAGESDPYLRSHLNHLGCCVRPHPHSSRALWITRSPSIWARHIFLLLNPCTLGLRTAWCPWRWPLSGVEMRSVGSGCMLQGRGEGAWRVLPAPVCGPGDSLSVVQKVNIACLLSDHRLLNYSIQWYKTSLEHLTFYYISGSVILMCK